MRLKIALLLIVFSNLSNNFYAQNLKTYSGKYNEGKATYTYKDNPEGGRIFEGNFIYVEKYDTAFGKFKNNKKDGLWNYKSLNTNLQMSYKDGFPEGNYQYTRTHYNPYSRSSSVESLSITIKNGRFVGYVKGTNIPYSWRSDKNLDYSFNTKVSFIGQFDNDGYLDGNWLYVEDSTIVFHAQYERGICQKCYREDLTTGDIVLGKGFLDLYSIFTFNFTGLEEMVNRGHSKLKEYDAERKEKTRCGEILGYHNNLNSKRSLIGGLPRPVYNTQEEGIVVIDIIINPSGYVIAASINPQTTTTSPTLQKAAIDAAKKARFNAVNDVNNQQQTITYNFNLR